MKLARVFLLAVNSSELPFHFKTEAVANLPTMLAAGSEVLFKQLLYSLFLSPNDALLSRR